RTLLLAATTPVTVGGRVGCIPLLRPLFCGFLKDKSGPFVRRSDARRNQFHRGRFVASASDRAMSDSVLPAASYGYAPVGKDNGQVKSKGKPGLHINDGQSVVPLRARKPEWLKVRSPGGANYLRL